MIKLLDCTLRDGGYINNWLFSQKDIYAIIQSLTDANIDYIEAGFLKDCIYNPNKTFFDSIERVSETIPASKTGTIMLNCGEYPAEKIHLKKEVKNIKIRVAFKKHNQNEAFELIKVIKDEGLDVFANPMSTNTYTEKELELLINKLNILKPYGVSIVDTLGNMYEKDVTDTFKFIDNILEPRISLGFHSHNSLQLSFSNAKALLKMNINREIIIDCCLYGMGRGAGNLCTELITKYLNDNYKSNYDINPILKAINDNIKPLYETCPWGYSTPYYIAAINGCHPNYAAIMISKGYSDEKISEYIKKIPADKKTIFDKQYIESIL